MSAQDNLTLVKQMYLAFGEQGDTAGGTPTTLELLAEEGEWEFSGPPDKMPWAGVYRGREQTARALAVLDELIAFEHFHPRDFVAQGDKVVVLGEETGRVKKTGRKFKNIWAHIITLRDGQIIHFRTYSDTAVIVAALLDE